MSEYVTTNIRLEKSLLRTLKLKAVEEDKSMGGLIRDFIARGIGFSSVPPSAGKRKKGGRNPFAAITNLGESGVADGAIHHDEALYGFPRKS